MSISTRRAIPEDYETLSRIFYEASTEYRSMRPDFYRQVNSLPPKWQFDFMLAAKKWGRFKNIEMIVATQAIETPIGVIHSNRAVGAIYMESVKRTPRSWSAFEKTAWIETLVTSSTISDPDEKILLQDALIEAGMDWARATGHAYISVKDIEVFKAHQKAYERAGMKPDYIIHGRNLI